MEVLEVLLEAFRLLREERLEAFRLLREAFRLLRDVLGALGAVLVVLPQEE